MIARGKIVNIDQRGVMVWIPYDRRYLIRECSEVEVDVPDGRKISPEQRRKAYALMGEIAEYAGMTPDEVKLTQKHDFVERHLEGLHKQLFSLADCDMTTAKDFITYLIEFVLEFGVPLHVPLVELCDDVKKAVCACLTHKKCIICGKPTELHHVDRVGMGGDRHDMCHIGMECLPLCREHHMEAHQHGDKALMDKYHLETVTIDDKIARLYRLGKRSKA